MQSGSPKPRVYWCRYIVVHNLGRRTNDDDFVLEKFPIAIIGLPRRGKKNFVQRRRVIGDLRPKADRVSTDVIRQRVGPTQLDQSASDQRREDLFAWKLRLISQP